MSFPFISYGQGELLAYRSWLSLIRETAKRTQPMFSLQFQAEPPHVLDDEADQPIIPARQVPCLAGYENLDVATVNGYIFLRVLRFFRQT